MPSKIPHFYDFGPFRLEPEERLLRRGGELIPLAPKAFDLLVAMVEMSGHLLTRKELLERVWADSFVEEANLSHNIYKLREALGEDKNGGKYIETVPRRGYRFVAKVTEVRDEGTDLLIQEQNRAHIVIEEEIQGSPPAVELPARRPVLQVSATPKNRRSVLWIGLAVLICFALAVLIRARFAKTTPPGIHSLAVLPFRPLSAEGRDEALELGMADALITKLSNVHQIVVRPTSAVLKYSDDNQDLLAAGREQGVDAVIDGKVQKVGDQIRATVQLVRVSDGASLWADTFDDQFTNVFAVQDSISERAVRALVLQLSGDEQQRVARHYTDNIQAYQLYLEGRYYWAKFSGPGVSRSIDYYNQAIAMDPNYALAFAGLADAYSVQGAMGIVSPRESMPRMKRAIDAALRLDASLPQAHQAAGGLALFYERDWPNARRELERSIELNPNVSDSHQLLGYYWEVMGDLEQAQRELELAQRVAPLMTVVNMDLASLAYYRRDYDHTIRLYETAHHLDPDFTALPFFPGQAYERQGRYDQAIAACQEETVKSKDDPALLAVLGYAYASAGKKEESQGVRTKLEGLRQQRYVSPFMLAIFYTGQGDKDEALRQLNTAYEVHDPQLIWVKLDPELDPLRSDPRFSELLQRLRIP